MVSAVLMQGRREGNLVPGKFRINISKRPVAYDTVEKYVCMHAWSSFIHFQSMDTG